MNPANNSSKKKRSSAQVANDSEDAREQTPGGSPVAHSNGGGSSAISSSSSSNFRNVSACNRCRLRKNRCDQKLPACVLDLILSASEKFPEADNFSLSLQTSAGHDVTAEAEPTIGGTQSHDAALAAAESGTAQAHQDEKKLSTLVNNIGMVSVQGASDARYLGSTSGISFARVVFAAVKSSVSGAPSERGGVRPSKPLPNTAVGGTSMRDSFFGLHTKPTIKPASFPDKEIGQRLVELYFEHSNPQIPTLHRGEYMALFDRVYATPEKARTPRELYMLNIIFAIGSGIIMDTSGAEKGNNSGSEDLSTNEAKGGPRKRQKLSSEQCQPEDYHASAIMHLESFLGSSPATEGFGGGLEELQAVLLLAGFALLRPVAPGLWYIVGVAVRLGVDLGLHNEDPDANADTSAAISDVPKSEMNEADHEEQGRRQWTRDLRRRLWWCVYSFDRLVSTCVGRPFGITDQVITTEFPTLLDDKYITTNGFIAPPASEYGSIPSSKHVSYHYFRLRLLQSEILQVLQHRQTQQVRERGTLNQANQFMHTGLPSPFLHNYSSFREWRNDIDRRLYEWIESSPTQTMTGVAFSPLFLELNYWQTVIMLYRQSLSVPPSLAGELDASTGDDVTSPGHVDYEDEGDEEMVFLKVAEAGQKVLKIYRQLHRVRLVNYTFLATHHLFMSGISFLYAIWHSTVVRSRLTLDDVDFTVLAATSVLGDLMEKCPPAEACRDAFDRMSKATISMCMKTTGFGPQALRFLPQKVQETATARTHVGNVQRSQDAMHFIDPSLRQQSQRQRRPPPRFDMDLKDLFSDDEYPHRPSTLQRANSQQTAHSQSIKQEAAPMYQRSAMAPPLPHRTPLQQAPQTSPGTYVASPPIDPSLQATPPISRQSPNQHQGQYFASLAQPYAEPAAQRISNPGYTPNTLDSLEFLDSFQLGNDGGGGGGLHLPGGVDVNGGFADYDLGFGVGGLAFDGGAGPSWEENGGFDLFDGFFFGGTSSGGGVPGL
ncbi:hypothetical protein MBLNU459_g8484t3 [Dothideomycetes sp. NU459]